MGTDIDTVHIGEDDPAVSQALSSLPRASGKNVRLFTSGAEFFSFEPEDTPACLILDLKMAGLDGLAVQQFVSETIISINLLNPIHWFAAPSRIMMLPPKCRNAGV